MPKAGKKYTAARAAVPERPHTIEEAVPLMQKVKFAKFDETVELAMRLGVDPKHADKIQGGFMDFDAVVATPDMMRAVGKLGKVLGPRGLMPNPKTGTVTMDIARAVREIKAGKVEFRVDKTGIIHAPVGKASFPAQSLIENAHALVDSVVKAKPAAAKGKYLRSVTLSSTMGPGITVDTVHIDEKVKH